jgi:hypothetical protein
MSDLWKARLAGIVIGAALAFLVMVVFFHG